MRIDFVPVLAASAFGRKFGDDLHRDTAGHFAGVVTAHAVGEHHQADVRIGADGIFVVIADPAGVRDFSEFNFSAEVHSGAYRFSFSGLGKTRTIAQSDRHFGAA